MCYWRHPQKRDQSSIIIRLSIYIALSAFKALHIGDLVVLHTVGCKVGESYYTRGGESSYQFWFILSEYAGLPYAKGVVYHLPGQLVCLQFAVATF